MAVNTGHCLHLCLIYSAQLTFGMWTGADSEIRAPGFPRTVLGEARKTVQDPAPVCSSLWSVAALRLSPPVRP